jgi:hypothetical protein
VVDVVRAAHKASSRDAEENNKVSWERKLIEKCT